MTQLKFMGYSTQQNTPFSSTDEILTEIDHIRGHKTYINKYKRTEIITNIFFEHKKTELKTSNKISGEYLSVWKLNSAELNNPSAMVQTGYHKEYKEIF